MLDISLDSDFSVHLDDRNDIQTVSKRDEFEQSIAIALTDYLYDTALGEIDREAAIQKTRLQVNRVARDHDRLDEVKSVNVTPSPEEPNTLDLRIVYTSDEVFELNISE